MANAPSHLSQRHSQTMNSNIHYGKKNYSLLFGPQSIFAHTLLHRHFTIRSDNKPSIQLITNPSFKLTTSATSRVVRWILSLQPYDFTLQHHPGKSNVVADALSRFPLQKQLECNATISQPIHPLSQQLTSLYQSHPSTSLLMGYTSTRYSPPPISNYKRFNIHARTCPTHPITQMTHYISSRVIQRIT